MNSLQSNLSKGYPSPLSMLPTAGQSHESKLINARHLQPLSGAWGEARFPIATRPVDRPVSEKLFDALASFKIFTSQVAMHLDLHKRDKLFNQLDLLLDPEEWPENDAPPELASYRTLLRALLIIAPKRLPGIGASSSGRLAAGWIADGDRLTIECFPNDAIRWSLSVMDGTERRAAAAESRLKYLLVEIAPYGPARWFS